MNLNISYDSNTLSTAPSGFFSAVSYVVGVFDNLFTTSAAINIEIGYGRFPYDNSTVPGLGESIQNNVVAASYGQASQHLIGSGAPGAGTLPANSPLAGTLIMGSAQEKALGLTGASSSLDGWVGIASNASVHQQTGGSWSFSPTATPGASQYYMVGVIEHEITEVMGRVSYLSGGGEYGVMDLYRYSGPGVRNLGSGSTAYFSTDGGATNLDNWNPQRSAGDLGDWAPSAGPDAFLNASPPGQINGLTAADITLMRALGWSTTTGSSGPALAVTDTTTNQAVGASASPYTGPVSGLQQQYVYSGSDNVNISVSTGNWFLHGGSGSDAIAAYGGTNVLDGGTGSNFLSGGSGTDTFFVDDRGPGADVWSTVSGFHAGDAATVFGVTPSSASIQWVDGQGASGYTGLTLHAAIANQPTASLTLAGFSTSDLSNGHLSVSFGNEPDGTPYMYVVANGSAAQPTIAATSNDADRDLLAGAAVRGDGDEGTPDFVLPPDHAGDFSVSPADNTMTFADLGSGPPDWLSAATGDLHGGGTLDALVQQMPGADPGTDIAQLLQLTAGLQPQPGAASAIDWHTGGA